MESVASIPAIEQSTLPQLRTAGAVQGCADAHQAVWMRSVRSGGDALPAPISLDFLQCRSGRGRATAGCGCPSDSRDSFATDPGAVQPRCMGTLQPSPFCL